MGAAAKVAGTRPASDTVLRLTQPAAPATDDRAEDWNPDRISDRKLLELHSKLDRLRRFGGAFADIGLSDQAQARLQKLLGS
jgi:hypothetical protein